MKKNRFYFFKILFVVSFFITAILVSEFIYINTNRPQLFSMFYVWRSQKTIAANFTKGLGYLQRAASMNVGYQNKKYPLLIPKSYKLKSYSTVNKKNKAEVKNYIQNLDLQKISGSEKILLSEIFYTLGTISYETDVESEFPNYLQMAIYLSPELSHYHVELANYYLYLGDDKKAFETIDFCTKFKNPTQHCLDFKKRNLEVGISEKPGFLKDAIEKYYNSFYH